MTVDITGVRPNMRPYGNDFADGTLNPPVELRAPPLAPNETTAAGHVLLRVDTIRPLIGGEDPFQTSEPSNPSETFRARRTMIAGTAIIATLGFPGLTSFFFASPGAKGPAESAPIAVQSSTEAPVEAAANVAEPSSPTSVKSSSETAAGWLPLGLSHLAERLWFLRPTIPLRSRAGLGAKLLQERRRRERPPGRGTGTPSFCSVPA